MLENCENALGSPLRATAIRFSFSMSPHGHAAGFNALLKIVEEPPEHVMFIFATTEPDKVIGTIRSRTHHYPFRLVPQEVMGPYLETICDKEGIKPERCAETGDARRWRLHARYPVRA